KHFYRDAFLWISPLAAEMPNAKCTPESASGFCGWEGVVRAASKMSVFTHRHHVSRCLGFKNLCILMRPHVDAAGGSVVKPENRVVHERSEEHTSELQSLRHLVCRLLLE